MTTTPVANLTSVSLPILSGLGEIADSYDVVLSDIWGVVHNGREAHPEACDALTRFRARGGTVILVTNAPRPFPPILEQLESLGAPRSAFDEVVTSGDVTLGFLVERGMAPLHHIGPPRDLTFFDIMEDQTGLRPPLTSLEEAQYVLCTGLFDDSHTPDNYARELALMHARKLDFICANPDLIVHVGETMLYCAGAIAQRFEDEGGRVLQAGKPFAPIYDRALMLAERRRGAPIDLKRVLAIGDALRTDVKGACDRGLDCVFVTKGIHRDEIHPGGVLDIAAMNALVAGSGLAPIAAMPALVW
jgi:HAD superfamily hydrolase (TIGR01459 family)